MNRSMLTMAAAWLLAAGIAAPAAAQDYPTQTIRMISLVRRRRRLRHHRAASSRSACRKSSART